MQLEVLVSMKQLIQSYKTGELGLFDVPPPICDQNGLLVATTASLVSAGTEKMLRLVPIW